VVCFSPRHDLSLGQLDAGGLGNVVQAWRESCGELEGDPANGYIQIFENRGDVMGCSNPHPHGQIWATRSLPDLPRQEGVHQAAWLRERATCMLCDYLALERKLGDRVVFENDEWLALVPFWAVWPFETMLLPRRHADRLSALDDAQAAGLADALGRMARRFDRVFDVSFPYSMGVHQAPCRGEDARAWHLHLHFFPPLLRSATVKKFMVGYEMLAMPQRDIGAEAAAERLRACSEEPLAT
jgi:UDPglucose--hexose-1-phosphate uridylyltransferase